MNPLYGLPKPQISMPPHNLNSITKNTSGLPKPYSENTDSSPLKGRSKVRSKREIDENSSSSESKIKRANPECHPFDGLEDNIIKCFKDNSKTSHILTFETLFFNGDAYPLINCGEGEFHKVFQFKDENREFVIDGKTLNTSSIILKSYKSEPKKNKAQQIMADDISAYKLLKSKGVPLPLCYVSPETLDKNAGPFMILEKIAEKVTDDSWAEAKSIESLSDKDKKVLEFAKRFLTLNAMEYHFNKTEYLGDFNPKNVMLNVNGDPIVIDPTLPETEEWEVLHNLKSNLKLWSRENPIVTQYLVSGFPESVRKQIIL